MKFLFLVLIIGALQLPLHAQDKQMEKFAKILPMISRRENVTALLGTGTIEEDSTWYYFADKSIVITFSDGTCTEEWLAPRDTVVEAAVFFVTRKRLSDLKRRVNLTRLRVESSFDHEGEKHYYDDKKGIKYAVNEIEDTWTSLKHYPSGKYSKFRCEQ